MNAKSGVYCGPLRLLAFQVFQKLNDLVSIPVLTVSLVYVNLLYSQSQWNIHIHCVSKKPDRYD